MFIIHKGHKIINKKKPRKLRTKMILGDDITTVPGPCDDARPSAGKPDIKEWLKIQ